MIVESENMKKLRERNLLAEIRAKTIVIQDAPPRTLHSAAANGRWCGDQRPPCGLKTAG